MSLPSFSLSKWAVVGLGTALLGGVYWLTALNPAPTAPSKARTETPTLRRGDDPTYADELRTMSALLQDMRYRFDQSENQRLLAQEQSARDMKEAVRNATQQSKQEVDRLAQTLRETREAAEQKIKEATAAASQDPRLKAEIERLTREINELRATPASRRDNLQGQGSGSSTNHAKAGGDSEANRVITTPRRPNRFYKMIPAREHRNWRRVSWTDCAR
ncbi:MAG: hypothetical protein IPK63_23190 [Candidatus Competibacteraceae bacterium]|nr:hypothetical protein [Candidatus Competibacteraceae bacterium]